MQRKQFEKKAIFKIVMLFALIISAIVLVRFNSLKEFLTADGLSRCLQTMGIWAPIAFIVVYALRIMPVRIGNCFRYNWCSSFWTFGGFVYILFGVMIGAVFSLLIGRCVFVKSLACPSPRKKV